MRGFYTFSTKLFAECIGGTKVFYLLVWNKYNLKQIPAYKISTDTKPAESQELQDFLTLSENHGKCSYVQSQLIASEGSSLHLFQIKFFIKQIMFWRLFISSLLRYRKKMLI